MKKAVFVINFILLSFCCVFAQDDNYLFKIIKGDCQRVTRVDGNVYKIIGKKKYENKKYLMLNDNYIDSSGVYFTSNIFLNNNQLFAYSNDIDDKSTTTYKITLNGKVSFYKHSEYMNFLESPFNYLRYPKDDSPFNRKIALVDPLTLNNLFEIDLSDEDKYSGYRKVKSINFLNREKLLITLCECIGGCTDCDYYVYDINTKSIKSNHQFAISNEMEGEMLIYYFATDMKNSYCAVDTYDDKSISWPYDVIINDSLKIIGRALRKNAFFGIIGYNYLKFEYESFNVATINEKGERVVIPYRYSLDFENSMYKVFHDTVLTENEYKNLDYYELIMLKNMLFAKHNYLFDKEYFQAFFNLFNFYNELDKKNTRSKTVSLSEIDKINLDVILKLIKPLESNYKSLIIE